MKKLFMIQLGAKPKGRLIEQHDMFFGVADDVKNLADSIDNHWQEAKGIWHIDAYRQVNKVDNYQIQWVDGEDITDSNNGLSLFFINLGGYLPNEFEEFHHKLLIVAKSQQEAVKKAKQSEFYLNYTYKDADNAAASVSHIDDKMQVDVDDIYDVNSLLSQGKLVISEIEVSSQADIQEDALVIGYTKIRR